MYEAIITGIVSKLAEGHAWHQVSGPSSRLIDERGIGRWHDTEAIGDAEAMGCLLKHMGDEYGAIIIPDVNLIAKAYSYRVDVRFSKEKTEESAAYDIEEHLMAWDRRETAFLAALSEAVQQCAADPKLYKKLFEYECEVQNERFFVRNTLRSYKKGGMGGHDRSVKSMIIHKYFECDYKQGDMINFNIG